MLLALLDPFRSGLTVPSWIDLSAIVVGALSGGLLAAREGFAVTGVLLLSLVSGLGGGLIRDVLLGVGTPVALTDPLYLPTVSVAALVAFFFAGWLARLNPLLVVLDALALGLFTVVGAEKADLYGFPGASVVFLGVVTAVGGGFIRDLILGQVPDIARPGTVNAFAALLGAILLVTTKRVAGVDTVVADLVTIVFVTGLRLLAVWRGWQISGPVDLSRRLPDLAPLARTRAVRTLRRTPLPRPLRRRGPS
ncbi:trimeric intracellular cation channel family protein [Jatrophihabitans sp. YIM 134969]